MAVPRSFIIVIGIMIMPALYAWLNVAAFWDPYDNTSRLPIAVVNQDTGASSELTGQVNVGDAIVEQLRDNHQLGWEFLSAAEADEKIHQGEVYARFVIPAEFSEQLVGIFSGSHQQATIEYSVNEKKGAIAPKITDAGANALDIQITSAFREQLGQAVAQALRDSGLDLQQRIQTGASSATTDLQALDDQLATTRTNVNDVVARIGAARDLTHDVQDMLAATDPALVDVADALTGVQSTLDTVVAETQEFAQAAGSASAEAQEALGVASADSRSALSSTSATLTQVGSQLQDGTSRFADGIAAAQSSVEAARAALDPLGQATVSDQLADIGDALDRAQSTVSQLNQMGQSAAQTATDIAALRDELTTAVDSAQKTADTLRSTSHDAVAALTSRVTALSTQAGALSGQVTQARGTLAEISTLVSELDTELRTTQDAVAASDTTLAELQDALRTSRTDVAVLASALQSGTLETITGLDSDNIGFYLASPVDFQTKALFPVASYGSAMAPMFINLSLWIGAFMLIVIFRVEVDKEGFRSLALRHAYFGRYLLLVVLAIAQAIIVSVGTLLIGVQTVNPLAFILTAVLIAINYFSIIYGLAAAFGHVGRAIAILLIIVQIPGASGLYPIELMPGFFRSLYPVLPFSYAIKAMREIVGGFYHTDYLSNVAVLTAMGVVAALLGLVLRRQLGYFTRLFNEDLGRSELVIKEDVDILGSGYRLSHIIALMSDRGEFSQELNRKRQRFKTSYPTVLRVLRLVALAGIILLGILARTTISKPSLLAIATVWGLLIVGVLVALESLKQSLYHASVLEALDDEALVAVLAKERASHTATIHELDPVDDQPVTATADATGQVPDTRGEAS